MSLPKYAATRDDNEPLIVHALRCCGWFVHQHNEKGFPDLSCCKGERILLIEVIGDAKAKKYRKTGGLTPAQVEFHRDWPGTIHKVRKVSDALALAGYKGDPHAERET